MAATLLRLVIGKRAFWVWGCWLPGTQTARGVFVVSDVYRSAVGYLTLVPSHRAKQVPSEDISQHLFFSIFLPQPESCVCFSAWGREASEETAGEGCYMRRLLVLGEY